MIDRLIINRIIAGCLGAVLVVGAAGQADAARKTSKSSRARTTVRISGPERSLAGIRIGRPAAQVLSRFGNPSRVDNSTFAPELGAGAMGGGALPSPTSFGLPASPTSFGATPGGSPSDLGGALAGALGAFGAATQPGPGFGPTASPMGASPMPGAVSMGPQRAVTKIYYDYPDGPSLVFTVGFKGRVEQIDAFAASPWSPAKTSRGINIGSSYKQVVAGYGYPATQRVNSDGTLLLDYSERAHCAFTLLGLRVIGVSVSLVE